MVISNSIQNGIAAFQDLGQASTMTTRLKLAAVFVGGLLLICFLVATVRYTQEPTYNGLTMAQWLARPSSQAEEALIVLGTNNLPLLLKRVACDPVTNVKGVKPLFFAFLFTKRVPGWQSRPMP